MRLTRDDVRQSAIAGDDVEDQRAFQGTGVFRESESHAWQGIQLSLPDSDPIGRIGGLGCQCGCRDQKSANGLMHANPPRILRLVDRLLMFLGLFCHGDGGERSAESHRFYRRGWNYYHGSAFLNGLVE